MKVLKFGGTSIKNSESIKTVAEIVKDFSEKRMIVLSAMSETTDKLEKISNHIVNQKEEKAHLLIKNLTSSYTDTVNELFTDKTNQIDATKFILNKFDFIKSHLHSKISSSQIQKNIVAQGEFLSTYLFALYLKEIGIHCLLISALDFMQIGEKKELKIKNINSKLNKIFNENTNTDIFITQGYIVLNQKKKIDNLKRGGSDYSASIIAAAIDAQEVQIWSDIDGLQNNDPRFVESTFSLKKISFDVAAELAYFGAKILHPKCVNPVQQKNIPILLKNTFNRNAPGTVIEHCITPIGIQAIASKDGITCLHIKSFKMLMSREFLKKLVKIFEQYKTSLDIITSSEIAFSLTINNTKHLDSILEKLDKIGTVEIDTDLSIICLAGNFSSKKRKITSIVLDSLPDVPIQGISFGGSNHNITLIIKTKNKKEVLNSLNSGIFQSKPLSEKEKNVT